MKNLILIGGGGHCKACIDVIEETEKFNIVGVLDKPEFVGKSVLGYNILGGDDMIEPLVQENHEFLITVGQIRTHQIRYGLYGKLLECNASLATVISPRAYVSKYALIGPGTIIMHDALVSVDARVGQNCIINSKALIEHDVVVGDHCHISTGAVVNGNVFVKHGVFWGSNAVSREGVVVEPMSFVQAGSVVSDNKAKCRG